VYRFIHACWRLLSTVFGKRTQRRMFFLTRFVVSGRHRNIRPRRKRASLCFTRRENPCPNTVSLVISVRLEFDRNYVGTVSRKLFLRYLATFERVPSRTNRTGIVVDCFFLGESYVNATNVYFVKVWNGVSTRDVFDIRKALKRKHSYLRNRDVFRFL